jgi:uncharacterized membrane protein
MLVVIFDNESIAYDAKTALQKLGKQGDIGLYAYAVIKKNQDGSTNIKQGDDGGPLGTLLGTAIGSLVGLLAGPVGAVAGATAGMVGGMTDDLNNSRISLSFLDDVTAKLTSGKVALVAEIDEDWTAPVDTQMESLHGVVFRKALKDVIHQVDDEEVASIKADINQMKAEHVEAQADRKRNLQQKVDALEVNLQTALAKSKQKREQQEAIDRAKAGVLHAKAVALTA